MSVRVMHGLPGCDRVSSETQTSGNAASCVIAEQRNMSSMSVFPPESSIQEWKNKISQLEAFLREKDELINKQAKDVEELNTLIKSMLVSIRTLEEDNKTHVARLEDPCEQVPNASCSATDQELNEMQVSMN